MTDATVMSHGTKICSRADCPHKGRPQPLAEFYQRKSACKTCCRTHGRAQHHRRRTFLRMSPYVVDREPGGSLPVGPWREWVLHRINLAGGIKGGGLQLISWELDVSERSISRWLHECKYVHLDVIDRCLCHRGTPWVLRELYPELYDFEEAA